MMNEGEAWLFIAKEYARHEDGELEENFVIPTQDTSYYNGTIGLCEVSFWLHRHERITEETRTAMMHRAMHHWEDSEKDYGQLGIVEFKDTSPLRSLPALMMMYEVYDRWLV